MFRRFLSKFVFAIGCCTLLAAAYIASFYVVRSKLILPFEKVNFGETHALRPAYNGLYYPLRYFIANGSSFTRDISDEYRGILEKEEIEEDDEKNYRSADIDKFAENSVGIGFVGRPSAIKAYDEIENGSFVRLTFGRALTSKHDRFINKLIGVEVVDLMPDPRIERSNYSEAEEKDIMNLYTSLLNEKGNCEQPFVEAYREKVLLHCQQAGYAQNIGGGCYHIVGYSLHTAVFEQAVKACTK